MAFLCSPLPPPTTVHGGRSRQARPAAPGAAVGAFRPRLSPPPRRWRRFGNDGGVPSAAVPTGLPPHAVTRSSPSRQRDGGVGPAVALNRLLFHPSEVRYAPGGHVPTPPRVVSPTPPSTDAPLSATSAPTSVAKAATAEPVMTAKTTVPAAAMVVLPPDDPRAVHIRRVLRKDVPGSTLSAGILGGALCTATVTEVEPAVSKQERRAAAAAATAANTVVATPASAMAAVTGDAGRLTRTPDTPPVGVASKAAATGATKSTGTPGVARTTDALAPGTLTLALSGFHPPPPPPRVDLLLAHPRPKVLARLLPALATAGIGRLVVANAYRVERCYWDSRILADVAPALVEGLCQGGVDTRLPAVTAARRLGVWVEDELGEGREGELRVVAHPGGVRLADALNAHLDSVAAAAATTAATAAVVAETGSPKGAAAAEAAVQKAAAEATAAVATSVRVLVAVGPEGGWMPRELSLLASAGFVAVRLGNRILRSDAAAVAAVVLAHDALEGVSERYALKEGEGR